MNLDDAVQQAGQILDEERISPTCQYLSSRGFVSEAAFLTAPLREKGRHPRTVMENPGVYRFKSENFDLLSLLISRLNEQDRLGMFTSLRSRTASSGAYRNTSDDVRCAGSWQSCSSELPLIAEFLVRNGQVGALLSALPGVPAEPGLTLLLFQIEEMIALDYRLFTDSEYNSLARAVSAYMPAIKELNKKPRVADTVLSNARFHVVRELPPLCESIIEMCRKAKFLRLKKVLSDNTNVEVNQDKAKVQKFLNGLGFSELLVGSLEQAERSYIEAANSFQLKECMTHLRSFLESLHMQACTMVHERRGGDLPTSWGKSVSYLLSKGVLAKPEEALVTSLYTLMSDAGVHPLIAEREYARLLRNINIEYGLLFLARLEKWLASAGCGALPLSTANVPE
jgi:hypothetical protein